LSGNCGPTGELLSCWQSRRATRLAIQQHQGWKTPFWRQQSHRRFDNALNKLLTGRLSLLATGEQDGGAIVWRIYETICTFLWGMLVNLFLTNVLPSNVFCDVMFRPTVTSCHKRSCHEPRIRLVIDYDLATYAIQWMLVGEKDQASRMSTSILIINWLQL